MISADSSAMVAYFQGHKGGDLDAIHQALINYDLALSPIVVSELLSDPKLPTQVICEIVAMKILEIKPGYWARAGLMRSKLIAKKLKAGMSDTLIAQSCIDNNVLLITRDRDFRHFAKYFALKIHNTN